MMYLLLAESPDSCISFWTHPDSSYWHSQILLNEQNIILTILRQIPKNSDSGDVFPPPWEHFVAAILQFHLNLPQFIKHIQFSKHNTVITIHSQTPPQDFKIQPTASPLPPGSHSHFSAPDLQMLSNLVVKFGGEGPGANPCGVGLNHAYQGLD